MVRSLDFLCQRYLAADASKRFSAGKTVSFLESRDLCFEVSGNHDDFIHSLVDANFEEKWNVIDYHCFAVVSCRLSCQSSLFARDTGMNYSFEHAQLGLISKDDCTQGLAIEGAVRIEDGLAEGFYDLAPGRLVRLHDLTGQFVGIDDDRPASLEHLGDGAFACGDAACEADHNHGCGA